MGQGDKALAVRLIAKRSWRVCDAYNWVLIYPCIYICMQEPVLDRQRKASTSFAFKLCMHATFGFWPADSLSIAGKPMHPLVQQCIIPLTAPDTIDCSLEDNPLVTCLQGHGLYATLNALKHAELAKFHTFIVIASIPSMFPARSS